MTGASGGEIDPGPVLAAARAGEFDRYIAALLAPSAVRPDLMAIAAFAAEIARVPVLASEPRIAEIRLQWWYDALAGSREATGHPVADTLITVVERRDLAVPLLLGMIDATVDQLTSDRPRDPDALRVRLYKTEGTLFRLAAQIVSASAGAAFEPAIEAAAEAYGLARLRHETRPESAALEPDIGDRARRAYASAVTSLADAPTALRPVFAPVALVPLYLRYPAAPGLPPMRRLWSLWRAARRGLAV